MRRDKQDPSDDPLVASLITWQEQSPSLLEVATTILQAIWR